MQVIRLYSGTSEQWTLWDQYKFKWFVPFIEVVPFSEGPLREVPLYLLLRLPHKQMVEVVAVLTKTDRENLAH